MDSDTAIQRSGFFPYAITPFLGGPLFHLLLCNSRCLCLLIGILQKINSTQIGVLGVYTSPVDIAFFSGVEAILRG